MKRMRLSIYVAGLWVLMPVAALASVGTGADDVGNGAGLNGNLTHFFGLISNILIYLVGAIGVIVLIIGGLRYVTSQGDATGVKAAKDTILYGVIGIVIAVMAYAIVNFVAGSLIGHGVNSGKH